MQKNIILTDADDVLLNWSQDYLTWMNLEKGISFKEERAMTSEECNPYIHEFNTMIVDKQRPNLDALEVIRELNEDHGFVFHIITAFSADANLNTRRHKRLCDLFGDAVWHITCLPYGASKRDALMQWKDSKLWWIEDNHRHYLTGEELGLRSILMCNAYEQQNQDVSRKVWNWKDARDQFILKADIDANLSVP